MWKMYTSLEAGVRIRLPKYPFLEVPECPEKMGKVLGKQIEDRSGGVSPKTIIPAWKMAEMKCSTTGIVQQKNILHKIEYTSDMEKLYPQVLLNTEKGLYLKLGMLGRYKNTGWAFQREWRYILQFYPFDFNDLDNAEDNFKTMLIQIINGTATLPFSHYDLQINDDAFSQMEIMLSPKITDGNRVIVSDLVEKYNPNATIVESIFKGTLA